MKRINIFLASSLMLLTGAIYAQQVGTITNPPNGGTTSPNFWSRAGNVSTGNHINNIFGTRWNSPIYFITDGTPGSSIGNSYRMKLNGKFFNSTQYPINGYTYSNGVNTTGYLLLGQQLSGLYGNKGPFSLLHLNGPGNFVQTNGYRPWMKTGITFTGNDDNSYVGLRSVGNQLDETEMVINWSDNAGSDFPGPDALQFRFSSGNGSTVSSNLNTPNDLDGLAIARFTANGNIGFGPVFGNHYVNPIYIAPHSLLQLGESNKKATWLQITNQNGTGQTANDGLRLGIRAGSNASGYLRWQENTPFIFQTDWNNTPGGINNGERMRLTTINPAFPAPPGYAGQRNLTRVAISEDGANPITQPRSLLSLGYNTGLYSFTPGSNDGWRNWMNIGTFTSNGTDNMYVGMKREQGGIPAADRADAIIDWGDNDGSNPFNGPDNLRFIFTSTQSSIIPGYAPGTGPNGLEVMRMVPKIATTLTAPNYGMVGIGNFSPTGPNAAPANQVNAKLDIDGDLRIRTITEDSTLTHVLVADPADHNRVHWIPASDLGGGNITANNGAVINPANNVQWGQDFGNTLNPAKLLNNRVIPLNNHNIYFAGDGPVKTNMITIGNLPFTAPLPPLGYAKLSVYTGLNNPTRLVPAGKNSYGIYCLNNRSPLGHELGNMVGVYGEASGNDLTPNKGEHTGGSFLAKNSFAQNVGVRAVGIGVHKNNIGVIANAYGVQSGNQGVIGSAQNGNQNRGVVGTAYGNNAVNYGVYGQASGTGSTNFAGWFDGNVNVQGQLTENGMPVLTSDQMFKQDVDSIPNALSIIHRLQPRSFYFNTTGYPQMNFSSHKQYGFIAQQVDTILPELVYNSIFPAQYDSVGNQISAAITYKSLNYDAFFAILMAGMQQQQDSIKALKQQVNAKDSINAAQDSAIANLNGRLTHLENCLQSVLPLFCSLSDSSNSRVASNTQSPTLDSLMHSIDVQLSNGDAVVLNQNVPNPFKEHTVIRYYIPKNVHSAKIVFSNMAGNVIKTVNIHKTGNGQLKVYGQDLTSGFYTYSIIVNGRVIKTLKMVKTN